MLTTDEAIALGMRKYREIYPKGLIPTDLEEKGVLGTTPGEALASVYVTFSLRGQKDPFYLFKATIDRATSEIRVETAIDWRELEDKDLDIAVHP